LAGASVQQTTTVIAELVGNPVHMLVVSQEEVQGLMRRSGPWRCGGSCMKDEKVISY
jgi:hypothetical protein